MKVFTMRRNCCVRLAKESITVIWDKHIITQVISQYVSSWNYLWIQTLSEVLIIDLLLISLLHRRLSFLKLPSEFVKPSTKPQYSTSNAPSVEVMCKRGFLQKKPQGLRRFLLCFYIDEHFPLFCRVIESFSNMLLFLSFAWRTNQKRKERRWTPWIWFHLGGCRHSS